LQRLELGQKPGNLNRMYATTGGEQERHKMTSATRRLKVRWRSSDIQEGKSYRVLLCQGSDDYRYYTLFCADDPQYAARDPDAYFETEEVEHTVLKTCNPSRIMRATRLTNGEWFGMDGHMIWLTEAECEGFGTGGFRWSTPRPPLLPPK
jgi:hypothetical protein